VNLGGLYITDNLDNPLKYQIPMNDAELTTVPAKGFILFWADRQTEQGALHLSFVLDRLGEQIGLAQAMEDNFRYIDSLTYTVQQTDISYGRYPDGSDDWYEFDTPTPEQSNVITNIQYNEYASDYIILYQNYPNPFNSYTVISYRLPVMSDVELSVYNLLGQKVTTLVKEKQQPGSYEVECNAERMKPGIYWCELKTGQSRKVMKMILMK
jgi:hypothetical protein